MDKKQLRTILKFIGFGICFGVVTLLYVNMPHRKKRQQKKSIAPKIANDSVKFDEKKLNAHHNLTEYYSKKNAEKKKFKHKTTLPLSFINPEKNKTQKPASVTFNDSSLTKKKLKENAKKNNYPPTVTTYKRYGGSNSNGGRYLTSSRHKKKPANVRETTETKHSDVVKKKRSPNTEGFNSLSIQNSQATNFAKNNYKGSKSIEAVIHNNQKVRNGQSVRMRITSDFEIFGKKYRKNTFVYGTAQINAGTGRLDILINRVGSNAVNFWVRDSGDFRKGIALRGTQIKSRMGDATQSNVMNEIPGSNNKIIQGSISAIKSALQGLKTSDYIALGDGYKVIIGN